MTFPPTYSSRDGAPFLLLIKPLQCLGAQYVFSLLYHFEMFISSSSCFAICGHHLSPRVAMVFLLLSRVPNLSICQIRLFSSSPPPTHPILFHYVTSSVFCCARKEAGGVHLTHSLSRIFIDARIPATRRRGTLGNHRSGRHRVHQARSAVRFSASRIKGELHPTKNLFARRTSNGYTK